MKNKKGQMLEEFRNLKHTFIYTKEQEKKDLTRGFDKIDYTRSNRGTKTTHYDKYRYKLDNELLESFNTRDILYYFKDIADENGGNYIISNFQTEMGKIKNILNKYNTVDVLVMIEFLFTSGQQYLDVKRLTPGILTTGWCNRIYNDSQDWLEDNFDPNGFNKYNKKDKVKRNREWVDDEEEW